MQKSTFEEAVDNLLQEEKRYHRDSYLFLCEALEHTRKMLEKEGKLEKTRRSSETAPQEQHVSGQQLLEGIRELALQSYGPMARTVFAEWGIAQCQDFGELVFIMVENGLLRKTDRDSKADFADGYDFFEAFGLPFLPKAKLPEAYKASKLPQN